MKIGKIIVRLNLTLVGLFEGMGKDDWIKLRDYRNQHVSQLRGQQDQMQVEVMTPGICCLFDSLGTRWHKATAILCEGKLSIQRNNCQPEKYDILKTVVRCSLSKHLVTICDNSGCKLQIKVPQENMVTFRNLLQKHRLYGQMVRMGEDSRSSDGKGKVDCMEPCTISTVTVTLSPEEDEDSDAFTTLSEDKEKRQTKANDKPVEQGINAIIQTQPVKTKNVDEKSTEEPLSDEPIQISRREILPAKQSPAMQLTWTMIWNLATGKSLPIALFEPLGFLQVLSEQFEYVNYIEEAMQEENVTTRFARIVGFASSGYCSINKRCRKPFNPRLAETFELDLWNERGWRYVAEQVRRKPDVSAIYVEGKSGWSISYSVQLHYQYTSLPLTITSKTKVTLSLHKFSEVYTWNKVPTCLHNVFQPANRILSLQGNMKVNCEQNSHSAKIIFDQGEHLNTFHGIIKHQQNDVIKLNGDWTSHLEANWTSNDRRLRIFTARPLPKFYKEYYGLTNFALQLNKLRDRDTICHTDSRHRPDVRLLEVGNLAEAEIAKTRIEKATRFQRAQEMEAQPQWFETTETKGEWKFKQEYWQAKAQGFRGRNIPQLW